MARPSSRPKPMASPKPSSVVHSVSQQNSIRMSKRWMNTAKILVGLGKMISGTSKAMTAISQTISSAASTSQGMAMRSISR